MDMNIVSQFPVRKLRYLRPDNLVKETRRAINFQDGIHNWI